MSQHHDEHGAGHGEGGGHGSPDLSAWMDQHMSGIIMPFGERMETFFEKTLVLSVNGVARKAATAYLYVMTPILIIEIIVRSVRF